MLQCVLAQPVIQRNTYRFYGTLATTERDCAADLVPAKGLNRECAISTASTSGQFVSDILTAFNVTRTVYQNNLNWGLKYLNADGLISKTYTIQLYVKVFNFNSYYTRIIDLSDGREDNGIYFTNYGTPQPADKRCLNFYPQGNFGPCPYFNNDTYYLLTFTRNDLTKTIYVYVNDALFTSYGDKENFYTSVKGKPVYLFRDDPVGFACEDGQAHFAYVSFTNIFSEASDVKSVYENINGVVNTAGITAAPDTTCTGNNITAQYAGSVGANTAGYTFSWDWDGGKAVPKNNNQQYSVSWDTPGTKTIKLTQGGACSQSIINTTTITVQSSRPPDLGSATTVCKEDTLLLSPGVYDTYLWQDGSAGSTYAVTEAGTYSVKVSDRCVHGSAAINITPGNCNVYFPGAFTPNRDGKNDVFRAAGHDNFFSYHLRVYNRFGMLLFASAAPGTRWNGTYNGMAAPPGTYIWQCIYQKRGGDVTKLLSGTVVLLR